MTQPSLLTDIPGRSMAQASLDGWDRIRPTLTARELLVCQALGAYLATGYEDGTGGEVAWYLGLPVTSVRPRLTGAHDKGYLTRTITTRASRCPGEAHCHAYRLVVPVSALARAIRTGTP